MADMSAAEASPPPAVPASLSQPDESTSQQLDIDVPLTPPPADHAQYTARHDMALTHPSSPHSVHIDHSAARSSHSRSLSPGQLLRPLPLLFFTCALAAIGTANGLLAMNGISQHECSELGSLLLWSCVACFATLVALQLLAHAMKQERRRDMQRTVDATGSNQITDVSATAASSTSSSLSSTLRWSLLSLLLFSSLFSALGIKWLSDGRCLARRSVRQLSLFDIIVTLSLLVLVLLYALLGRLPPRYSRQIARSGGKSLALIVCLIAFTANVVQLQSHDANYGFTSRSPVCPLSCLASPSPSVREVVCRDHLGAEVELEHCANLKSFGYTNPSSFVSFLQPCPALRFAACRAEYEALTNASSSGTSPSAVPSSYPPGSLLDTPWPARMTDPDCPTTCVDYPAEYKYPGALDVISIPLGCWRESKLIREAADPQYQGVASGWVELEECEEVPTVNTAACPPRPCPTFCDRLEHASLLYACVFGLLILVLVASLFRKRLMRSPLIRRCCGLADDRYTAAQRAEQAELEQTIRVPAAALGRAPRFTVDDEDEMKEQTDVAVEAAAASSGSGVVGVVGSESDLPSVWQSLRLAVRALCLSREGLHHLRPWWKHLLFLLCVLLLSCLSLYSLSSLMWLTEAHCRDFLVSTLLNGIVTLLMGLLIGALMLRQRGHLLAHDSNPWQIADVELTGLLDEQGEEDAHTEEDDEEEGEEEEEQAAELGGAVTQATAEQRVRLELQQDPSAAI